jgi:hypothetical protein
MLQCCNAAMLQCCNAAMLQCCNAALQQFDLLIHSLPENRFQSINADLVQNFSNSRKKFTCRPELLALEVVFEMHNKKQEKVRGS